MNMNSSFDTAKQLSWQGFSWSKRGISPGIIENDNWNMWPDM
jgi:hypothetical protein